MIPIYNKGPHIARSINSVLPHTFQDIELIIVNDASTDNSLEEVAKFSGPRISLYHREKPGPGDYAARNLGIEKAKAEWIAFLDADDEWMPRHLESYFEFIDTHADINMFGCGWLYEQKGIISTDRYYNAHKQKGNHVLNIVQYLKNFARPGYYFPHTSTACIRKHLLKEAGGFPEGIMQRGGDLDTWLRCALLARQVGWSSHIGGIYHKDSVNMVTQTATACPKIIKSRTEMILINVDSPAERNLLKQIHNGRIISCFKSQIMKNTKFPIHKFLFFESNPLRFVFWSAISLFPETLIIKLTKIRKAFRTLFC